MTSLRKTLLLAALVLSTFQVYAQKPDWIKNRPVSSSKYIGIGSAPLTDADYQNIAMTNAMREIATEISVNIESSSFMHKVDVDGNQRYLFEEKVRETVASHIVGQQRKGTYQDQSRYYVYYELDKKDYEKFTKENREKGIATGLDYYSKAKQAEKTNNFTSAIQLYSKGLEAVEPYLYLDLTTTYQGRRFDVPSELYNGLLNVFGGLVMVQNVSEVGVEAFKASGEPLAVCLSKNGEVVPNVMLSARFVNGDGQVTEPTKTDANGTSVFYITNVTSKQSIQEVEVKIDESFIESLPVSYRSLVNTESWPVSKFTVVLMNSNYTAYFMVENNDLEDCERQVRSILTNNYFELTEDTGANLFITMSTTMKIGDVVPGELYNMNEIFSTLTLKIYDNFKQTEILNFTVPEIKTLVPDNKSEAQAEQMCVRELMKRVKANLPKELKNLNINL